MQIYLWIIAAFLATILTLSVLILCYILILKLTKNRLHTSRHPIIVRPETTKPINAFDESIEVYDEILKPSVITVFEYLNNHKANIKDVESERSRASSRKPNWISEQRIGYFVDRDPPSNESKCDYLDPLDLNLSQLHNIYIAGGNHHLLKQMDTLRNNEPTVTTYA
uniref:Bm1326, isoform b n=1 Tax=Brugia malayi TaxID=6279 RepID=A0A1U7F110_BRUMA|nr:Bm1326, isoform b [Brugia malayi]